MKRGTKKKLVIAAGLVMAAFGAVSGAHAYSGTMPVMPACATQTGVHPMPHAIPQPGLTCGNGFEHGVTILVPAGMPGAFPGRNFPRGAAVGFPPAPPLGMPMGPLGHVAGALGANREWQLAAECSSAGDPTAVAACIAGSLTVEELQKCANGIGSPGGCFGPSNTLRKYVENAISDMLRGPGRHNEVFGSEGFICKRVGVCF